MSSRDYRRRERSWEKEDRGGDRYSSSRGSRSGYRDEPRRRSSRSRSPRRSERDRRDHSERHRDDRRERDSRKRDDEKDKEKDRPRETDREREREATKRAEPQDPGHPESNPNDNDAVDTETGPELDDEAAMMAAMGMSGFGTTKGKHVEGNQEGASNLKKTRTWRQYMNRRGGFNRPLDKIK